MTTNRVAAIHMISLDSSTLTGGYDEFVDSLEEACFLIRIVNACNQNIAISYNGTQLHDVVPAGTAVQLNFQTNSQPRGKVNLLPKGQRIWISGPAGVGFVYFVGYYNEKR